MNRADVEMLDNQIDKLGDAVLRQRQMKDEAGDKDAKLKSQQMRTQADIDLRNAQSEHYNAMESKQDQHNAILEKQIGMRDAAQQLSTAQQSMKDSITTLANQVKAGKMTQDLATQYFKDSMDNGIGKDNPQLHDQMLAQPQYKAMYDGAVDWSTIADQMAQQTRSRTVIGSDEHLVDSMNSMQEAADAETDPVRKADLQRNADGLRALVAKHAGLVTPASSTQTQIKQTPPLMPGGDPVTTTNTVQKVFGAPRTAMPGSVAPAYPANPGAGTQQPIDIEGELASAQQSILKGANPAAVRIRFKQRTGQDYDQVVAQYANPGSANAATQSVPGFGSAQQ